MIEIDAAIIDADLLLERVRITAASRQIPEEFYGNVSGRTTLTADTCLIRMHQEMVSVYQNLQMMNATWILAEKELYSTRPVIGRWIVLGKRIFRRLTRWLLQPFYQQQTEFNGAAVRTISDMIRVQELLIRSCESGMRGGKADAD